MMGSLGYEFLHKTSFSVIKYIIMRCGYLSVVTAKTTVSWDVTPHSLEHGYRRFGGKCCLHLRSRMNSEDVDSTFPVNFAIHLPYFIVEDKNYPYLNFINKVQV
jgi:hypothetical protein